MNYSSAIGLVNNAALLLALCLLYDMLGLRFQGRRTLIQQIFTGIILGAIGLAIMFNPWDFGQGVVFDTRSVLLVISGFFFGAIPVVLAVLMTSVFRFVMGGAGVWTGLAVIVTSGAIGLLWRYYRRNTIQKPSTGELYLLGIIVHVAMLGWMFLLPWQVAIDVLSKISLPVMLIYPVATAILGKLMVVSEKRRQAEEELRESEERYRELVENANSIILRMDNVGRVTFFNEYAQKFLGYETSEIIGKSVIGTIVPEIDSAGVDLRTMIIDIGIHPQFYISNENENMRHDGTRVWIAWTNKPFYNSTGEVSEILCVGNDITERKRVEAALRASAEDLKESQRIAHVGSWRLDIASNQVVWSEELYKIYGFDPALPPPPYTEHQKLFKPESWDRLSTALQNTRDTGISYDLELEILRADGSPGWIWVHGMAVLDARGLTVGLRGVAQDITGRKQIEEALRESEVRYKALHNASFGGICIHDKGIILECNQGLSRMTGYSIDELIGMNGLLLISEKTRDLVLSNILSGYEKPYEALGIRKNNEEYHLLIEARNVPYKGRNVRAVEFRDITEQKQGEKEKEKLEEQLRQAQKMEAIGQLAGGVAHDFNNMLGVIIGYSDLILEQVDPSQQIYTKVEEIRKAAQRSADLTRQLLTFARKQTVALQVLDLNQTIEGMLNMLRRLIGENIKLIWMPGANLWPIKMDPSQIDQILANLCVNARDAIAGVGEMTVETENAIIDEEYCDGHAGAVPGEYVRIAVSDNGKGMDKEILAHIFEPFFTTKGIGEGTGLGLATVYGAVKQNNGFINAYSESGLGTTFTIYIPRYRHVDKATKPRTVEVAEHVLRGDEVVLLVEDEQTILDMAKIMLERLGFAVLAASTPSEALRLASEFAGQIHLLMTDVVMPEMSGRDLADRLVESRPKMKHLYMSGYTANIIAKQGVLEEGVLFIQKPFSNKELTAKVREALES